MNAYHMARRVLMAEASGGWVRGRLRLGLIDGVKVALGNIGMMVEAVQQCAKDRKDGEPRCRCNIEVQVLSIWAKVCMFDDCVCVCYLTDIATPPWWREKVMVYYFKKISPRLLHSTSNRFHVDIVAAHVFVTDVTALCRGVGSPPNPTMYSHWIYCF